MVMRDMLRIDEAKCNGCGLCIPACAEGAIKLVDGKAKLINEKFCDGLGACIGECPRDAISIEKREAKEFDKEAVDVHLKEDASKRSSKQHTCPSIEVKRLHQTIKPSELKGEIEIQSMLSQWPVQLTLLPTDAPFFEDSNLLVIANCVPFTYPNLHMDFLKGKTVVVGCPKLDDSRLYEEKLAEIFHRFNIKDITVVNMEVPCCNGLYAFVNKALNSTGKNIPLKHEIITIHGNRMSRPNYKKEITC